MALPDELAHLPPPSLVQEISYEESLAAMRARLVAIFNDVGINYNVENLETDPGQILLQVANYELVMMRVRINEAIRSWFLAYSYGSDLDVLANWYDVTRMVNESDDALKRRVIEAIRGRSPGGTEPRYRSIALGASPMVADAAVYTVGRDPTIHVAVFSTESGGVAGANLLATVNAALQDPNVRMVNDTIVVAGAAQQQIDIVANLWLLPEASDGVVDIAKSNLQNSWASQMRLGRDLTLSWLTSKLQVDGVHRVEVLSPSSDIAIPFNQAGALGTVTLNLMGRAY